jgi:eukaryotic-like serine/threonine-protein kinase
MPELPVIASRYRLVRELGRGGMGVVFVVEHIRTGEQFALKLLQGAAARDPQAIERFKREARAPAHIKSEHVVKVIDADVAPEMQNTPFFVMELLNGTDLRKQIETSGRLTPADVLRYLTQAARALDKAHAIGIVHRDLKPENLFVHHRDDDSTILKILDFGISKIVGRDGVADLSEAGLTISGAVMGTPLYMAPEQARGQATEIKPATDVWAMGLVALNLLTGQIYWRANTVPELMAQMLSEPLYPPSQRWSFLPRGVDEWFARSCARDPKQRFESIGQQVQALAEALAVPAVGAPPPAAAAPHWKVVGQGSPPEITGTATPGGVARGATSSEAKTRKASVRNPPLLVAGAVLLLVGAGSAAWLAKMRADAGERAVQIAPSAATSVASPAIVPSAATPGSTPAPALASASAASPPAASDSAATSAVAAVAGPHASAVAATSAAVTHVPTHPGLAQTAVPVRVSPATPPLRSPAAPPAPAPPRAPTQNTAYNPAAP